MALNATHLATDTVSLPCAPSFRLDGRRALVTGAGRGLGLAAAAALAHAQPLSVDITDVDGAQATLGRLIEDEGPFDILVNNAGTNRPASFGDVTINDYDAVMALNVRGTFFVSQLVSNAMIRARRPGSIIHVSSQMGHVGGTDRTVYCASKHALEGLAKAMAIELGAAAIRVNTVCPTFIETPMTAPFFVDDAFRADVIRRIKLGRIGQVEDVTGAIVFLASDASALITGSAIMVDGGWTAE